MHKIKTSNEIHPRTDFTNRFPLFQEAFKDVNFNNVLDFGGNRGNLLYFSEGKIKESNYTCIDVSIESIKSGWKEFPLSDFLYYDRYNWAYNHNGKKEITLFDPKKHFKRYDVIWAWSVFSHTDYNELVETLSWMIDLSPKRIVVSFLSDDLKIKKFFFDKRVVQYGDCVNFLDCTENILILTNNDSIYKNIKTFPIPMNVSEMVTFYDINFLMSELKKEFCGISIKLEFYKNSSVPCLRIDL